MNNIFVIIYPAVPFICAQIIPNLLYVHLFIMNNITDDLLKLYYFMKLLIVYIYIGLRLTFELIFAFF